VGGTGTRRKSKLEERTAPQADSSKSGGTIGKPPGTQKKNSEPHDVSVSKYTNLQKEGQIHSTGRKKVQKKDIGACKARELHRQEG